MINQIIISTVHLYNRLRAYTKPGSFQIERSISDSPERITRLNRTEANTARAETLKRFATLGEPDSNPITDTTPGKLYYWKKKGVDRKSK